MEIKILAWDRHRNVAGLNRLTLPLLIFWSPLAIQWKKPATHFL